MVTKEIIAGFWPHEFAQQRTLGLCHIHPQQAIDGIVEIGYEMHEDYRLQGLTTEAAKALMNFAFAYPDVDIVRAHTISFDDNPSVSVLKKLGFELKGLFYDPDDGDIWRWEIMKPS